MSTKNRQSDEQLELFDKTPRRFFFDAMEVFRPIGTIRRKRIPMVPLPPVKPDPHAPPGI